MTENAVFLSYRNEKQQKKDLPKKTFSQMYLMAKLVRKKFPEMLSFGEGARFF